MILGVIFNATATITSKRRSISPNRPQLPRRWETRPVKTDVVRAPGRWPIEKLGRAGFPCPGNAVFQSRGVSEQCL